MSEWISVEKQKPSHGQIIIAKVNDIISEWIVELECYICPEYGFIDYLDKDGNEFPCIVTEWMPK